MADMIEVATMSEKQRREVVDSVMTSIMFVEDSPPPQEVTREIATSLMERDARFEKFPTTNQRGGQSTYLQNLHEAIMAELKRPVQQDPEVAESYVSSGVKLPDVDQDPRAMIADTREEEE